MTRDTLIRNALGNIVIYTMLNLSYDSAEPFCMVCDEKEYIFSM